MSEEQDKQIDENSLAGWTHTIKELGNEVRQREERQRQEMLDSPHTIWEPSEEQLEACYLPTGIWRIAGGIITAVFRGPKRILDVHSLEFHPTSRIDAMVAVRNQSEPVEKEIDGQD
jgi:hypothetical protein